jgi:hypothetical protein
LLLALFPFRPCEKQINRYSNRFEGFYRVFDGLATLRFVTGLSLNIQRNPIFALRFCGQPALSFRSNFENSETFVQLMALIAWTEFFRGGA